MTPNEQAYWNLLMEVWRGTTLDKEKQTVLYAKLTPEEIENLYNKYYDFCENYDGWGE